MAGQVSAAARRRVLWTGVGAVVCAFLSYFFLVPVYPAVAHDLGVGPDVLGLLVGGGQLLGAVLQIPAGVAADRWGRRPFLVGALVVIAFCQVLRWVPGGIVPFAVAQTGIGLSLPLIVSSASAAVADAYAMGGRAQALGVLLASANVGQVAGYVAMGQLAGVLAWRQVSLALALLPALLTPLAMALPEPSRGKAAEALAGARVWRALRFLAAAGPASMLVVVALGVGAGNSSTYLLPFIDRANGLGPRITSLLLLPYVAGSVVLAPLTGRVADRVGVRGPLLAWSVVGALAAAGFALGGPGAAWVPPCYVLLGGTTGSLTGLAATRMADLADRPGGPGVGAAMGGLRSAQSLGPALGPPLSAVIYVSSGFRPAFLALSAALAMVLAVVAAFARAPAAGAVEAGGARPAEAAAGFVRRE